MIDADFTKHPEAMLDAGLPYFATGKEMPEELKEEIKKNLTLLQKVPEGILLEHVFPYLECNIFESRFEDIVETGLYDAIYQVALTIPFKKKD